MIFNQRGISLIEVMMAFLLIGIGAMGLLKLHVVVESKADFAEQSIEALYIAENKIESFTRRGIASYQYADIARDSCVSANSCTQSDSGFQIQCSVSSSLSGAISLIDVEVCWWDRFGDKQSLNITTAISQYSEFN